MVCFSYPYAERVLSIFIFDFWWWHWSPPFQLFPLLSHIGLFVVRRSLRFTSTLVHVGRYGSILTFVWRPLSSSVSDLYSKTEMTLEFNSLIYQSVSCSLWHVIVISCPYMAPISFWYIHWYLLWCWRCLWGSWSHWGLLSPLSSCYHQVVISMYTHTFCLWGSNVEVSWFCIFDQYIYFLLHLFSCTGQYLDINCILKTVAMFQSMTVVLSFIRYCSLHYLVNNQNKKIRTDCCLPLRQTWSWTILLIVAFDDCTLYLRSPKGVCCSISDNVSCSCILPVK